MGYPLKQSTAVTVVLGPFVDDTDFKTPETGLIISAADVRISKNGGTYADATGVSVAHGENGYYLCTFATGNVDTLGALDVQVLKVGALAVYDSFPIEVANSYNSKHTASDLLKTDVTEILTTTITESSSGRFAGNISTFYDNADAATTRTVDDVDDVTKMLGSPVVESSAGRIAGNVSVLFNNGDLLTTKTVNDIGSIADTTANKTVIQTAMNELAVDTLTFEDFLNIGLSVFSGKFVANTDTGATIFYRQNESDQTISISTTAVSPNTTRTLTSYTAIP